MSDNDTTTNDAIVRRFCAAWGDNDIDGLVDAFTDDAIYHNIPMEPMVGKTAIETTLRAFLGGATISFEIRHQVASGDVVMNERTDTIQTGDKIVALPVMGVFVLRDGKIAEWRDYFDLGQFQNG